MSDVIENAEAVTFYQTLVQMLQGGDTIVIKPSEGGKFVTIGVGLVKPIKNEEFDDFTTSNNLYRALLLVA